PCAPAFHAASAQSAAIGAAILRMFSPEWLNFGPDQEAGGGARGLARECSARCNGAGALNCGASDAMCRFVTEGQKSFEATAKPTALHIAHDGFTSAGAAGSSSSGISIV